MSVEELQCMVNVFVEVTAAFGQEVSIKKTEVMVVHAKNAEHANNVAVYINDKRLNQVDCFKYVGSTENNTSNMNNEVSVRIQRMAAAYSRLASKLFENKRIKLKTKLRSLWIVFF